MASPRAVKRFKVIYNDGREFDVSFSPRAQVQAERHFGRSLMEANKIEECYYMGYCAMLAAGLAHGTFEDFLDILADVDKSEVGDSVDPTVLAAQPDGSSGSA